MRQSCDAAVMPRPLRLEYPGAIYHLMSRGDHRQDIFRDDQDRHRFISTLAEACEKTEWQAHAYCLMSNHFHLVVETPAPNLVAGMKWLLGVYTRRYNIRHRLCGHLFAGRYKALHVDGGTRGYLRTVCDYVHLNPARAKLLQRDEDLKNFPWSSYGHYLSAPRQRPAWLCVHRLLGEHGIAKDSSAGRQEFAGSMEQRRAQEERNDYNPIRRGWCLGNEDFRRELISAASERVGPSHPAARRQETEMDKAQRIVQEELKRIGWKEKDLPAQAKGAKAKIVMARRLRKETTMTLKWIAIRLEMGSWTYVSNLLQAQPTIPCAGANL